MPRRPAPDPAPRPAPGPVPGPVPGPTDGYPSGPTARRILVAGTSGSGKTTLARRLSAALEIPHTELDGLHHGPRWTPRPEFEADVRALAAGDSWVTEWQYRQVRPLLLGRAELLVWLDLPVPVVMWQVVRRTVHRRLGRTVLWNGNVEPPLTTFLTDPDHIVRWAWRTRHKLRRLDAHVAAEAPHVRVVRLRSRRAVDRWLTALTP